MLKGEGPAKTRRSILVQWLQARNAGSRKLANHMGGRTYSGQSTMKTMELRLEERDRKIERLREGFREALWALAAQGDGPWGEKRAKQIESDYTDVLINQ